ncbi:unnamed protein product [Phytophthora fragariaefolia]|uniref:Unnamed protein product n=1 Tax=Phytophthora fragariaefolia TaxID=1490495 RepID=A0A9W6YHI7_9STRA|nr:unnamed protein product [Phytophthora fragariaefolia]
MLACSRAAGLHDEAIHNQAGLDCVRPRGDPAGVTIPGIATGHQKAEMTSRRGPPAGNSVERVDIVGHSVLKTAAPSESHLHCKKKDDKPNLAILKVNP